jgi:hypothetical protein
VRRRCDMLVRIPMRGKIDSLNAAVAGSVLLYEASAQREAGGGPAPRPASEGASVDDERDDDPEEPAADAPDAAVDAVEPTGGSPEPVDTTPELDQPASATAPGTTDGEAPELPGGAESSSPPDGRGDHPDDGGAGDLEEELLPGGPPLDEATGSDDPSASGDPDPEV